MSKKQNQTQKSTLTFAKVKKNTQKYNESTMWEFSDGETLKVYPYFRPSTIEKLLEDLQKILIYAHEEKTEDMVTEDGNISDTYIYHLIQFLCVKHFTAAKSIIKNDPPTLIAQQKEFVNSIYYAELINEVFIPSEMQKVWDKVTEFMASTQLFEELGEKVQDRVVELRTKHADAISKLDNIKPKQIPEL